MTFPKPHYIGIAEVTFFKAYPRGGTENQSCTVERPSLMLPPYRCTITDLSPAKAYWIKSEAYLTETNRCLSIEEEKIWTLPSGELPTWAFANHAISYFPISINIAILSLSYGRILKIVLSVSRRVDSLTSLFTVKEWYLAERTLVQIRRLEDSYNNLLVQVNGWV